MGSLKMDQANQFSERITSVDFFRGFTMFLLVGESTRIYTQIQSSDSGILQFIGHQFEHHPWHGLHFWDLIQPFFMFIVGVAIPFAIANRKRKGDSDKKILLHVLRRSFLLLFFGWSLSFIPEGALVFRFQNVLAQLSVTYLFSYLIMSKSYRFQIIFSLLILLLIDLAYRFFPVEGFNHPWTNYQNLGAWFNNTIEGVDKSSEWATLNFVSTTAHTVWGVLCGKLLQSKNAPIKKIKILVFSGITALIIGYSLDLMDITPIIKKIATSSFVFASGGWAILVLALCYWLIDVKNRFHKGSRFFIIVGMNSIFIYMFCHLGGAGEIRRILYPFCKVLFSWSSDLFVDIVNGLAVWAALWYICFWLYKNKVFIKI
ncbi:MAG: acyltransferase family protein [Bacteroidota bacterium]